ncbi:hypothetical protein K470DRAFT_262740 [Piedraia hortae CBS 480.64]|uniref:F-box domain-containing protein n=1 Tax=Piedraia hortae CBS 480.64 TaxID=1314780 RepID=A0A6A7C4X2_9PEZI|nr:hypothetical protein K470DRAFT_262740 [Piedraia hortae CBS 480.64]
MRYMTLLGFAKPHLYAIIKLCRFSAYLTSKYPSHRKMVPLAFDILVEIAKSLKCDKFSLLNAAKVCRSWNDAVAPCLWREVPESAVTNVKSLNRRQYLANGICSLHLRGSSTCEKLNVGVDFPKLRTLSITFEASLRSRSPECCIRLFLVTFSRVKNLTLIDPLKSAFGVQVIELLGRLDNLRTLEVYLAKGHRGSLEHMLLHLPRHLGLECLKIHGGDRSDGTLVINLETFTVPDPIMPNLRVLEMSYEVLSRPMTYQCAHGLRRLIVTIKHPQGLFEAIGEMINLHELRIIIAPHQRPWRSYASSRQVYRLKALKKLQILEISEQSRGQGPFNKYHCSHRDFAIIKLLPSFGNLRELHLSIEDSLEFDIMSTLRQHSPDITSLAGMTFNVDIIFMLRFYRRFFPRLNRLALGIVVEPPDELTRVKPNPWRIGVTE